MKHMNIRTEEQGKPGDVYFCSNCPAKGIAIDGTRPIGFVPDADGNWRCPTCWPGEEKPRR